MKSLTNLELIFSEIFIFGVFLLKETNNIDFNSKKTTLVTLKTFIYLNNTQEHFAK